MPEALSFTVRRSPLSCDTFSVVLMLRGGVPAVTVTVASGMREVVAFGPADTVSRFSSVSIRHHSWSETASQTGRSVDTTISARPPSAGKTIGASGRSVSRSSGSGVGPVVSEEHPASDAHAAQSHSRSMFFIGMVF